jgi:hypothetical protein
MFRRKSLLVPSVLTVGVALSLTACGSDSTTDVADSAPSTQAPASGAPSTATGTADTPSTSAPSQGGKPAGAGTGGGTGSTATATATTAGSTGSGGSGSADYAYTHPCDIGKLSVRVTPRPGKATQHVIEVRSLDKNACGLSHHPLVGLGGSRSADRAGDVKPLIPGGLGGAPAYPLEAGQKAYAVIDLNPGGTSAGAATDIDQINVLVDSEHMPNAATLNFPLPSGTRVLEPKLGLYRSSVSDAASSMTGADTQS